jgi:hypothetical protein
VVLAKVTGAQQQRRNTTGNFNTAIGFDAGANVTGSNKLVVRDTDGQPLGVRYHVLPAMLPNELQRQQRQPDIQASRLAEQDERVRDQARLIDELTARLSRLEAKGAPPPDAERLLREAARGACPSGASQLG